MYKIRVEITHKEFGAAAAEAETDAEDATEVTRVALSILQGAMRASGFFNASIEKALLRNFHELESVLRSNV